MCTRSLERAELQQMETNGTNGLVDDRAAQRQRVSIQCVCDKRRVEMLDVEPLIKQSFISSEFSLRVKITQQLKAQNQSLTR